MQKTLFAIIISFSFKCTPSDINKSESYEAGFKIIQSVDTSRLYKPNTDTTDYLHYRPLNIDIWYPSISSATDSVLLFRNILGLLEKRANYYGASNVGNGITQQLAQYFCEGFKCSDTTKLLNYKTKSFKDAAPVNAKFPLVIYLTAFNGMSYENFSLFEELAQKGFVVVSISSIGKYPGDMTMKKKDLMEQVNDAVASLNILKQNSNIGLSKIGIIGYSWGGLASSILATKIPNVACFVSLDGSEFHHYGKAKDENIDFNNIRNSVEFKNMRLSIPYLRLESSPMITTDKEDSIYDFTEKLSGEKFIYKIDSAQHEDFGCMSVVVPESGHCKSKHYFKTISKLSVGFLEERLKNKNSFAGVLDQEMNKTIRKK